MKITRGVQAIAAQITNLIAANIKTGITIFGITGTYDVEAGNPIAAARLKTGDVGFVNGAKVTGNGTKLLSPASEVVEAGYYAATTLSTVDADLATANIKAGVTVFGIVGKTEVVDTTEAVTPAAEGDIALGKVAWVNGTKVTGTKV